MAVVDGGLKVGQLAFGVEDLSCSQVGFPLALERRYDSRSRGPGDFGPGWNLPASDVKARTTAPLGKMWSETGGGGIFGIPSFFLVELQKHMVVIRLSDEEVLKFKMEVSPKTSLVFPVSKLNLSAGFAALGKTRGTLEALDFDSGHLLMQSGQLYEFGTRLYEPKRFRYTRPDGTKIVINTETGIESITDVYGNAISYSEAGITHSSGASISFERGTDNRIEKAADYFGNEVVYRYDAEGNLTEAELVGSEPQFQRMLGNYLSIRGFLGKPQIRAIKAPDGTSLGSFEYDNKGRVTAMTDANGKRLIYGFDTEHHRQTITDRRGFATVYEYDDKARCSSFC